MLEQFWLTTQPQAFYELLLWNENYIKCSLNLFMYSGFLKKKKKQAKPTFFYLIPTHSTITSNNLNGFYVISYVVPQRFCY